MTIINKKKMGKGFEKDLVEFWKRIYIKLIKKQYKKNNILDEKQTLIYQKCVYQEFKTIYLIDYLESKVEDYDINFIDLIDLMLQDLEQDESNFEFCAILVSLKKYIKKEE